MQNACALSLGFGEDSINASSVLVMPMVSSRMTGFRGTGSDRSKFFPIRGPGWNKIPAEDDVADMQEMGILLSQNSD